MRSWLTLQNAIPGDCGPVSDLRDGNEISLELPNQ